MSAFELNEDQKRCLERSSAILGDHDPSVAIIRGYAGTGKSTMMAQLHQRAVEQGFKTRFLAPTNSAAMNLHDRIGMSCDTIHQAIYKPMQKGDLVVFEPKMEVVQEKVLWLVDEASMVPNRMGGQAGFQTPTTVLRDLIAHGKRHAKVCKMVFVGDLFQLPPVNEEQSDALSPEVMAELWGEGAGVVTSELSQVMRQKDDSPIRDMTTRCIDLMRGGASYDWKSSATQVGMPKEYRVENAITATASDAPEHPILQTVSIVFSNKEANFMNKGVRDMMDREDGVLSAGDHLVTDKASMIEGVVIPKGTRLYITDVDESVHKWGGCRFQGVEMVTELSKDPVRSLVNLDVLFSEKGLIGPDAEKKLKEEAMRTNPKYREYQNSVNDEHMNAIRARFGYAMTAHKAQGREFETVFVKPIWMRRNPHFQNWQWFYTAMTRAKSSVSAINFYAA